MFKEDFGKGPKIVNVENAATLDDPWGLEFRGRFYVVRPIGARLGFRLQFISLRLFQISQADEADTSRDLLQEYYSLMLDAQDLFRDCVRPSTWIRRLLWRVTKVSPFVDCTQREIEELLDFFSKCRMSQRGAVRRFSLTLRPRHRPLTSSSISLPISRRLGKYRVG